MKPRFISFIPAILWFFITTFLLVVPGHDLPHSGFLDKIHFDKFVHIGLFGGLTFLTAIPYIKTKMIKNVLLIKICIVFIIYGVLMEFVQKYFAIERAFDYFDMIADGVGCITGAFAVRFYLKIKAKNKPL